MHRNRSDWSRWGMVLRRARCTVSAQPNTDRRSGRGSSDPALIASIFHSSIHPRRQCPTSGCPCRGMVQIDRHPRRVADGLLRAACGAGSFADSRAVGFPTCSRVSSWQHIDRADDWLGSDDRACRRQATDPATRQVGDRDPGRGRGAVVPVAGPDRRQRLEPVGGTTDRRAQGPSALRATMSPRLSEALDGAQLRPRGGSWGKLSH